MDITHDNVCSSMLSCFYSHLLSTGRPISSFNYILIHPVLNYNYLFFFLDSMLFNQILCNFCFPYLTTSPTCSEAGGAGDLVSQLIYLRKSSCVVPSKKERQSLHGSLP